MMIKFIRGKTDKKLLMGNFRMNLIRIIIVCFLSTIGTNLTFNQSSASSITCNCINASGLPNVDCIQKCYKPYVERNLTTDRVCNIERCKANISNYLFRSKFLKDWLQVIPFRPDIFIIRLSIKAKEQLSLYNNLDFNLSVTLVESNDFYCRYPKYQRELFLKHPNSVKLSSIRVRSNTEVLTKKIRRAQLTFNYIWRSPPGPVRFEIAKGLLVEVRLAGNISGVSLYWPMELKTVSRPQHPSTPTIQPVKVRKYSDYLVEAIVKWNCNDWYTDPVSYKVQCLLGAIHCANQRAKRCWQEFADPGKAMLEQKFVSWREQETSVAMRAHSLDEDPVVFCRVQASNGFGKSYWSDIKSSLYSTSASWANIILEVQTGPTSWSYVSYDPLKKVVTNVLMTSSGHQLFAQRHNQTKFLSTESTHVKYNILPIGCYDWLADHWYVFVEKLKDETTWLTIIEHNPQFTLVYLHKTMGYPKSLICDPTLSTVIWSEMTDDHFVVKIAHLNSTEQQIKDIDTVTKPCGEFMNGGEFAVDLQKSALFLTSSNQSSKTFWKMDYRSEDMNCTKLFNTNFETNSSVASLAVFSSPYNPIYGNKVLVVLKHTVTKVCPGLPPSNGNFSCLHSVSNHTPVLEYYGMSDKEDGTKILMDQDGNCLEQLIPTNHDELEYWPWFTSHIKAKFNGLVNRVASFILVQPPVAEGCMYPNVTDVSSKMTSKSTAELSIHVIWDDSETCESVSKPKILFTIMYRLAKESDRNQSCVGSECSCVDDVSCFKRQKGPTTERILASMFLPNMKPSLQYYLEVSVTPDLGPYTQLWYNDDVVPTSYQRFISSEYVRPSTSYTVVLLSTLIPLTLSLIVIFVSVFYWKILKLYIELHLSSLRQIPVYKIEKTELLGSGNFCHVWKANINEFKKTSHIFRTPSQQAVVAVKELKKNEQGFGTSFRQEHEKRSFLEEALLLNRLKHNHIIRVLGISMDARPMMLVMEFMDSGSLDLYLRMNRDELSADQLLHISVNCCSACKYLENKGIIHRDIKTKNCLVSIGSGSITVKLADLGLAKVARAGTYEASGLLVFPVQYTAPEGFEGLFTSKSDVWSFGVLLWELFAFGAEAFGPCLLEISHQCPIESFERSQVHEFVVMQGKTLADLPIPCGSVISEKIQRIQEQCWKYDPEQRPNFEVILNQLKSRQPCPDHEILEIPTPVIESRCTPSSSSMDTNNRRILVTPKWYESNMDPLAQNLLTAETENSGNVTNICLDRIPMEFEEPQTSESNTNTEQLCQIPISLNFVLPKCINNSKQLKENTEQPSVHNVDNQIDTLVKL